MFPSWQVTLCGVCFRESLVFRLYSEIGQIHLSIVAQCGTACLPMGDCHIHPDYTVIKSLIVCKRNYFTRLIPYFTTSKFCNSNTWIEELTIGMCRLDTHGHRPMNSGNLWRCSTTFCDPTDAGILDNQGWYINSARYHSWIVSWRPSVNQFNITCIIFILGTILFSTSTLWDSM